MSAAEVVKKRGRPKKVIDPTEVAELAEVAKAKKTTTRAKSSKTTKSPIVSSKVGPTPVEETAPKTTPAPTPSTSSKATVQPLTSETSNPPPPSIPTTTTNSVEKPVSKASTDGPTASAKVGLGQSVPVATKKAPVTPGTSKILSKVRELPKKAFESSQPSINPTRASDAPVASKSPANTSTAAATKPPTSKSTSAPNAAGSSLKPTTAMKPLPPSLSPSNAKPKTQPTKPISPSKAPTSTAPKPKIPVAALNSAIVSNISAGAGARPNPSGKTQLPPNYKPVARKVTNVIVAMPILLVTSYFLYQRLVLGEERKQLVAPGMSKVDGPGDDAKVKAVPESKQAAE